jgi:hypothetical protein
MHRSQPQTLGPTLKTEYRSLLLHTVPRDSGSLPYDRYEADYMTPLTQQCDFYPFVDAHNPPTWATDRRGSWGR